jgi:hypothetical protein
MALRRADPGVECSGYVLSGPARWSWEHSILAAEELRYSITLRTLR